MNDQPARMVFDTGASVTVLRPSAAARLGVGPVKPVAGELVGVGGKRSIGTATVRRFAFGNVRQESARIIVAEVAHPSEATPADGILGQDILRYYEVDLDLPSQMVRLYEGSPCDGPLPGWRARDRPAEFDPKLRSGYVVVPVVLQGRPGRALIDTGAGGTLVGRDLAVRAGVPADELTSDLGTVMTGIGPDQVAGKAHRFDRLEVGGQQLGDVEAAVAAEPLPGDVDLILGEDYLRVHKLWISRASGRVEFAHTW